MPHRVLNQSHKKTRFSLPLFLNPPLSSVVTPFPRAAVPQSLNDYCKAPHIHRVLSDSMLSRDFTTGIHFGEAEWRRKGLLFSLNDLLSIALFCVAGLNGWCHLCAPALRSSRQTML
jgi:hypothetical protein